MMASVLLPIPPTSNNLFPPFVPADVDLRNFHSMPVEINRLFASDFHAHATDGEWRAGVTLWMKSFHQVPAGSLPADDVSLARLAEFGRDMKSWRTVKERALHRWIPCTDGRLYHRVVAEKTLGAWIEKLSARRSSAAGHAGRGREVRDDFDAAIDTAVAHLFALNSESPLLRKHRKRVATAVRPHCHPPANGTTTERKGKERREEPNQGDDGSNGTLTRHDAATGEVFQ